MSRRVEHPAAAAAAPPFVICYSKVYCQYQISSRIVKTIFNRFASICRRKTTSMSAAVFIFRLVVYLRWRWQCIQQRLHLHFGRGRRILRQHSNMKFAGIAA